MSSLEDGFGGGVDDMVSANTGELRNIFWALPPGTVVPVLFAVPQCHFANGTNRSTPLELQYTTFTTTCCRRHSV